MSQPGDTFATTSAAPARLLSLDAFRGLTIAGMLLVNNPGSWSHVYAPLRHAEWHGWTPTDLIFPSFLLIVGCAIPLSLGRRIERGDSRGRLFARVIRRSLLIFALGLLLNAFPFDRPLLTFRIPGVLQRIAVCYLVASAVFLTTGLRAQVITTVGLLLGYWMLMTCVPVPGIGTGDLSRPGNLAAWVDRGILGGHLYKKDYDPEGLLSTIPAVATTLIGVLAGRWLAGGRPVAEKVAALSSVGFGLFVLGWAWEPFFPLNKALWTSSFVLYCAGLSLLTLGVCGWLIEVENRRRWATPFLILGSNAILAFVLSGLLARVLTLVKVVGSGGESITLRSLIYQEGFARWAPPHVASLLFGLSYVLLWLGVLSVFYRYKLFLRV
jgi:predicted acyltransferase